MKEKIVEILKDINEDILTYSGDNMIEEGIIDSLQIMQIIMALEEEFDFEIDLDDIEPDNFKTTDIIVEFVRGKIDADN